MDMDLLDSILMKSSSRPLKLNLKITSFFQLLISVRIKKKIMFNVAFQIIMTF